MLTYLVMSFLNHLVLLAGGEGARVSSAAWMVAGRRVAWRRYVVRAFAASGSR